MAKGGADSAVKRCEYPGLFAFLPKERPYVPKKRVYVPKKRPYLPKERVYVPKKCDETVQPFHFAGVFNDYFTQKRKKTPEIFGD